MGAQQRMPGDRGRLRRRAALRPPTGRRAPGHGAGPRGVRRHGLEDPRPGRAARLGGAARRLGRGRPARPGRGDPGSRRDQPADVRDVPGLLRLRPAGALAPRDLPPPGRRAGRRPGAGGRSFALRHRGRRAPPGQPARPTSRTSRRRSSARASAAASSWSVWTCCGTARRRTRPRSCSATPVRRPSPGHRCWSDSWESCATWCTDSVFGYVVRRLVAGVLVLMVVSIATFSLFFYGPNDPAYQYCPDTRCTPGQARADPPQHGPGPAGARSSTLEYMSGYVKSRTISNGGLTIDCAWPCMGVSFKYGVNVRDLPDGPRARDLVGRPRRRRLLPGAGRRDRHRRGPKTRDHQRQGDHQLQPVRRRRAVVPAVPARLALLRQPARLVPGDRLPLAVHRGPGRVRERPVAALAGHRHRLGVVLRALQPRQHDRGDGGGLRPDRAGQGRRARAASSCGTPCAPPSCRS